MAADAAGYDQAGAAFRSAKDKSSRQLLDEWLVTPVDPRQLQADLDFARMLTAQDDVEA